MCDYLSEGLSTTFIDCPIFIYATGDLAMVRKMLTHPEALYSLGDGVAHVGTICHASSTTTMLAHCPLPIAHCPLGVAAHARLHLPLTTVVNLLSQRNAEFPGFHDRGVIAVGKKADLNLVKLAELSLLVPQIVCDLPAGGGRIVQKLRGYVATFVSGQSVAESGEVAAARPGRWARASA